MKKIMTCLTYYTLREYILIIAMGLAANLSIRYYPLLVNYPKIVEWFHEVLNLPGPGGGVFLPGSLYLFWAILLFNLTGKRGAIALMTAVMLLLMIFQTDLYSGSSTPWNIGLAVLAVACEFLTMVFKGRKAPGKIVAGLLAALSVASLIQILAGVKIWPKDFLWPGAVPIFIAAGSLIAVILLVKEVHFTVAAAMAALSVYLVYTWLAIFFPPFKPPVGYPVIMVTVLVSSFIAAAAAYGLATAVRFVFRKTHR